MAGAADEDEFFVLTAALLTPPKFPAVLGDDYPAVCAALGLLPHPAGYGLIFGQDGTGARWTVVVDDASLVAVALATWDVGMEHELSPADRDIIDTIPGWPLALAVAAPGIPDPHDPTDADRPPLTPPDTGEWGPAQRRLGADEIALHWRDWRDRMTAVEEGDEKDAEKDAEDPGVRRVLADLRDYVDNPPPPGRIRSTFATDDARTLRADGPGWSLVARTDDLAFVLLDDAPGEVIPVTRGEKLPALLTALDGLAARPS
ncbi:hypothetical protein SRB5_33640 [Streptomyces sp. RB5]|uniref:Integral membrane protein n=1 Tax=Streptomyces smaragdinus TaxID=2585196 RepID=A0A7K0CIB5_9ACTN|nr:hypothetical protein [Streptomyces smaragdinus]MQY13221.1 hypothetical protein [Streptomyces smaragdinus]